MIDSTETRILLIEDNEDDFLIFRSILSKADASRYAIVHTTTVDAGLLALEGSDFDIVVVDDDLGQKTGQDFLDEWTRRKISVPVMVLIGQGGERAATAAIERGAVDCLSKTYAALAQLPESIARTIREWGHITSRECAKRELADQRRLLNQVLEHTSEVVYQGIVHPDGSVSYTYLSPHTAAFLEVPTSTLSEMQFDLFQDLSKDSRDLIRQRIQKLLQGTLETETDELQFRLLSGTTKWLKVSSSPRQKSDGTIELTGLGVDITEAKEAERKEQENRDRLWKLFQHSELAVLKVGLAGEILAVNPVTVRLAGYESAEAMQEAIPNIKSLLAEHEDWIDCTCDLTESLRVKKVNLRMIAKDGQETPTKALVHAVCDASGTPKFYECLCFDVTRRGTEERASEITCELAKVATPAEDDSLTHRNSESVVLRDEILESISDTSRDAIIVLDDDGKVVFWSKAADTMFGYSEEEVLGRDLHQVVVPENLRQGYIEGLMNFARTGKGPLINRTQSLVTLTRTGRELLIELKLYAARHGDRWFAVGVARDMTTIERQGVEQAAVAQPSEPPGHSNNELQQFAHMASHDLQEPLRKLITFSEFVMEECGEALGEDGRRYIDGMQRSAARMQQLVGDLRALSRVTNRVQSFTEVDLNSTVHDVLADLAIRIQETGGCVEVSHLPVVQGDATQLRQLLQNLIDNALTFNRSGVVPRVEVRACLRTDLSSAEAGFVMGDKLCELTVQDNGIGVAQEDARRIFTPLERLRGRDVTHGTGLGLAVCYKIVEWHHGTITATSNPGRGATFTVRIPFARKEAQCRPLSTMPSTNLGS